jgi:hypothetical protein
MDNAYTRRAMIGEQQHRYELSVTFGRQVAEFIIPAHELTPAYRKAWAMRLQMEAAMSANNTLHPNHSETAQERPASPASGAISKDAS